MAAKPEKIIRMVQTKYRKRPLIKPAPAVRDPLPARRENYCLALRLHQRRTWAPGKTGSTSSRTSPAAPEKNIAANSPTWEYGNAGKTHCHPPGVPRCAHL